MALLLPAATAQADSVIRLAALPNGLAVDGVHVFLAVEATDGLQVRSLTGAIVATVPDQPGALRLTLNPDRSRLFVLRSDGNITAINTTTLAEVDRWTLPSGTCGQDIAWAGASLFVAYSDCSSSVSSVATLDTADPIAQVSAPFSHEAAGGYSTAIEGGGNVLVTRFWDGVSTGLTVVSFEASALPPTQLASAHIDDCYDAAVTADGSEVTLACSEALETRRTSDLVAIKTYARPYAFWVPDSVAESSGVLAVQAKYDGTADFFLRGGSSRLRTVLWGHYDRVWHAQLAFTPDASRLFAVTRTTDNEGGAVLHADLRIVTYPGLVPLQPSLSLTADKSKYAYGGSALVTAHLGTTHDSRRVDIFATPYNGTKQLIKSGDVNASGNLTVRYTVTRRTVFTVVFAADDRYASKSVTHAIKPRALLRETLYGAHGTRGKYALYRPKTDPVIGVVILPTQPRGHSCVGYKLQRRANGAWHNVATNRCRRVAPDHTSAGRLGGPHDEGSRFRLRAILHGSEVSARTKGAWCYIRFLRR